MTDALLERFHTVLVDEIRAQRPDYLTGPFTVAEIYQNLVPYGSHRDRIGVEMNGDYEDALVRLLAGEGGYLEMDSEPALRDLRAELKRPSPNTGIYREFAAVDVRLNPDLVAVSSSTDETGEGDTEEGESSAEPPPPLPGPGPIHVLPPGVDIFSPPESSKVDSSPSQHRETTRPPLAPEYVESAGGESRVAEQPASCPSCRERLPEKESLRFCPFCGTDVRVVPCRSCGETVEAGWSFCIACGADVSA